MLNLSQATNKPRRLISQGTARALPVWLGVKQNYSRPTVGRGTRNECDVAQASREEGFYSYLRAISGSMRVALRAGT